MPNAVVQRIIDQLGSAQPRTPSVDELHPADVAQALERLDEEAALLVLSLLSDEKAAHVVAETDEPTQERILALLSRERVVRLLNAMDPDDAADVIECAPEESRAELLAGLDQRQRRTVRHLHEYAPDTAGGIMTPEAVVVGEGDSVRAALLKVRTAEQLEALHCVYVVDPAATVVGEVQLVDLLKADLGVRVGELMTPDPITVSVEDDQEEVARVVEHYRLGSVPVVDAAGRFQGVVTVDDVIDVLGEEVTEDMLRLAGTGVQHPTSETLRARLVGRSPWLGVTLAGSFGAALLIEFIEKSWFAGRTPTADTLFKSLLYFIPLIGSMAGNVGTQSCTIMIRGFATGDVDPERPMRVLPNELILATIIGVVGGALVGALIALLNPDRPWLGLIVGVSLPFAVLAGAVSGTLIPFACHRIKVDPAYAGGPFLSTMNDVSGYVVYFLVALALIRLLPVG